MIDQVLEVLVQELNHFLQRQTHEEGDRVILSPLVDLEGKPAAQAKNTMVCTLVNIEEEARLMNVNVNKALGRNAPTPINLYILLSAYFPDQYSEGLRFLSHTLRFFQGKKVFTPENTPGLPTGLDRVAVDLFNMTYESQSHLWTSIGARMLPSVVLKLRMISISQDLILEEIPEISHIDTSVRPPSAPEQ